MATDVNRAVDPRHGIDETFLSESIADASEDELSRYLEGICSGGIPNQRVHPAKSSGV